MVAPVLDPPDPPEDDPLDVVDGAAPFFFPNQFIVLFCLDVFRCVWYGVVDGSIFDLHARMHSFSIYLR